MRLNENDIMEEIEAHIRKFGGEKRVSGTLFRKGATV